MPSLIVIRIVPQAPTDPNIFTNALASLTIEAFDLSFTNINSQPAGQSVGKASFIAAGGWTPIAGHPDQSSTPPSYPAGITNGIIQQVDSVPGAFPNPPFFQLEAVGIAIIEVNSASTFENLRLAVQSGAQTVPIAFDYYDVPLATGSTPNPATFGAPPAPASPSPNSWAALSPSLYLQFPASLAGSSAPTLQLSSDGTPPKFQDLLNAVQKVLGSDPGASVPISTSASAAAGTATLKFAAGTAGISAGMSVSGLPGAIPAGTTVISIDATALVTLSQQLSAPVTSGTPITFTPALGALSFEQCKNIAYEIVWSQQPPLPSPPPTDPLEDLYTNPPNTGAMLGGSGGSTTPNPHEGDRQQFEAQLKSYYTIANATADRLTSFVFSLSAAIACQQQSLAATQALLNFPASPGSGSANNIDVVLTGLGPAGSATNFGVPAAYFYALAAKMPPQVTVQLRYSLATREPLTGLLADLTSAINLGTVADSESFAAPVLGGAAPAAGTINAAQAARRLAALYVPVSAATLLAPLDAVAMPTVSDAASGNALQFASVAGLTNGMSVNGPGIASGTTVAGVSLAGSAVTLSPPIVNDVPAGTSVVFTPVYSGDLQTLIQSWLSFPGTPKGAISSTSYQPGDDDTQFWPGEANAHAASFLNLVLCALTQGSMLPPPFSGALGDAITTQLLPKTGLVPPATVAALTKVTSQQWTSFFEANPTWLPGFTQPGDTAARIDAFIRQAQKFFAVGSGGPSGPFVLATTAATAAGGIVLQVPPTHAIATGMSVSGPGIAGGTTVASLAPPPPAATTSVTLSKPVLGPGGVALNANITFSLSVAAGAASAIPALPGLAQDWFAACLAAYGAFTLGNGFNLPQLQAAAATVFPGDRAAEAWIVDALVALDALYQIMKPVALPAAIPAADAAAYTFSVIEALYARGFTSAARITQLSGADFQEALAGTVAYDLAAAIYTSASAIAPPAPVAAPGGGFKPVNPDGALTNCIPPPCSSPLGPVAYLSELLKLSEISTCEAPVAAALSLPTNGDTPSGATLPFVSSAGVIQGMLVTGANIADGTTVKSVAPTSVTLTQPVSADVPDKTSITFTAPTLGAVLGLRRGPIGDLAASCSNLETELPLIDIANECLEYMASQAISHSTPMHGTVYDTSAEELAGTVSG